MNNKNSFLVIVLVLSSLLSSCNRPKIKYHIIGNDTIASYIHIGGKDKKDYVILNESFCNSFNATSYRIPQLDTLLRNLGIDTYIKEGYAKKGSQFGCSIDIFTNRNGFEKASAYSPFLYYLHGYYNVEEDEFGYVERNLRISIKDQKTTSGNAVKFDVEEESYKEYKRILSGSAYSDTLISENEIKELMLDNHVENYHTIIFYFNNLGRKQAYAGYKGGKVSYYTGPRTMKEANTKGLKEDIERIKKSTDNLLDKYYNDVASIEIAVAILEENESRAAFIRRNYSKEYPEIARDIKDLESHIDKQKIKIFPLLRSRYISIANSIGWESNIEVSGSGKNRTIVFTSYRFASNKNIKEMFDGLEPILKKLRFQEAEFKWTKNSEVTSKWIYSKDDDE